MNNLPDFSQPNDGMGKSHAVRIGVLEYQVGRIVSDIESEKGTRMRTNQAILDEIVELKKAQRTSDRIIWTALGALGLLQWVLQYGKP
jgi:hypothetical protein